MVTALLFPGQGSQRVGMGAQLARVYPAAQEIFDQADAILGLPLARLMFEGPEAELTLTCNAQPAILVNSYAVFQVLRAERELCFAAAAGHSLGEWTALVATGALDFPDAVRLVRLRGEAMQEAVPPGIGAMAALLGLDALAVDLICAEVAEDQIVAVANHNGAGQIVIAGHAAAVERATVLAKARGARRAVPLPVSAPFHCALMAPAAERLSAALADVRFRDPSVPVISNVDAEAHSDAAVLKELLIRQVTAPVRWEASVRRLADTGVTRAYELGAGSVLTGLVKRIAPSIQVSTIGEPHEMRDASA